MSETERHGVEDRLRGQIEAYHAAALAYAAVKLALPETMGAEAWTAKRLAAALGLSAPHLARMLHGLATLGLVEAQTDGTFMLTDAGRALAPGASTLREKLLIVIEQYWQPWAHLADCVTTGTPAFELVFGKPVGAWRRAHTEQADAFDSYLARESFAQAGPIVAALDLAGVKTVADIGGGHGGLLAAILQANPELYAILFDQPHPLEAAKDYLQAHGVAERVTFVAGDILTEIPVEADLFLLKSVLQQHDDAHAQAILEALRRAMPDGARLAIIERLMPDRAMDDPAAVMLDLHMMTISGGRTRTQAEMEALLSAAGLKLSNVTATTSGLSLLSVTVP